MPRSLDFFNVNIEGVTTSLNYKFQFYRSFYIENESQIASGLLL